MIAFAAYTAAETPNVFFSWPENRENYPSRGNFDPLSNTCFLNPRQSAPKRHLIIIIISTFMSFLFYYYSAITRSRLQRRWRGVYQAA